MTRDEAQKKYEQLLEDECKKTQETIKKAKKDGTWPKYGLGGDDHLFEKQKQEFMKKVEELKKQIDE